MRITLALFGLISVLSPSIGQVPWDIERWKMTPKMKWIDREGPIWSLTFENEHYQNRATDVFAFYATPGTIAGNRSIDKDLPAIVLIHGGGGTAFTDWVWLWAKRGYAAIAMDLSGRMPEPPKYHPVTKELISGLRTQRTRLDRGGPEADHVAKFENAGGDFSDDWQVHSVAAVTRAHSLIRSFEEVDEERTAVTGISWGGYMTCLVASLDDRYRAAVPVYGCGFLYDGESVQRNLIDRLSDEKRQTWIRLYDPSSLLSQCRVPILFVNGTNDKHYPLRSYQRSYDLVPALKQIRVQPGMRHSHVSGWMPQEIGWFVDQHLNDGDPLPKIEELDIRKGKVVASVSASVGLEKADLNYTIDSGPLVNRSWKKQSMDISDDRKSVSSVMPSKSTICLVTVTDTRGAMVSSAIVFVSDLD